MTLATPRAKSQEQNWISNLLYIRSGRGDVGRATANESRHDWDVAAKQEMWNGAVEGRAARNWNLRAQLCIHGFWIVLIK